MRKTNLPNSEPIRHLDAVCVETSRGLHAGSGFLRNLRLCGALALLSGPCLTLAAQQPQTTQAPAGTQKANPQNPNPAASTSAQSGPAKPEPAKPSAHATHTSTQSKSAHTSAQAHHTKQHTARKAAAKPAEAAAATPAAPQQPPPPDWPANHQPTPATVVWDSHGLEIQASNSSLDQILHDVANDTGAKVEGLGQDQRIFGSYGPGPAREVLSKLLDGSGYNVLMIGGAADQPPQQVILSTSAAGAPQLPNTGVQSGQQQEDQDVPQEQNVEQDYRPPEYPMPSRNPFGASTPRTPQEIQQQIQQRQQQQEQQQQQQQGSPQPQQPQNPQ